MKKLWTDRVWENYLYWQMEDKKILKKIKTEIDYKEMVMLLYNRAKYIMPTR